MEILGRIQIYTQRIKSGPLGFVDFMYLLQLLHMGEFTKNLTSEWTLRKFQVPEKFSMN